MTIPHGRKWLKAAFVFIVCVLIDCVYLYQRAGETAPVKIPPYPPLPSPNGFDLYMKAARELVRPKLAPPKYAGSLTGAQLHSSSGPVATQPELRRLWLASNAKAWTLLAQAQTLQTRLPNLRAVDFPMSHWAPLRELARAQSIRAQHAKLAGKWAEATDFGLDTIQMGRDLERGASVINGLVSMAIEAIAFASLEDVPSHLNINESQNAARRLENIINTAQPYSDVIREEKWRAVIAINTTGTLSNERHANFYESLLFPRVKSVPAVIATMDALIPQADKPKASQTIVEPANDFTEGYPDTFPVTAKTLYNNARRNTHERLLLLRLALRAYFLEHGTYPPQLTALVPAYLQKIPVDPYGKGEAPRYQRSGASYTLWSLGPDAVDNHATPVPFKSGQKRVVIYPNSLGDIVAQP